MSDEQLRAIAMQCANMARTDLRNKRKLDGIIAIYNEGEGLHRMRKIEQSMRELAGEGWTSNGAAKAALFDILRLGSGAIPPDCLVFASIATDFDATEKFRCLPLDEQKRVAACESVGIWERVSQGYFEPHDALVATAQTPTRVCIYRQRMLGRLFVGEPDVGFCNQRDFGGRMKIFADVQ